MENNKTQVIINNDFLIPDITPLPMSAPVLFFAPVIDIAIKRGIARLKTHVQRNPNSGAWVSFGWLDGGLNSNFVNLPIGYFRLINDRVEFAFAESPKKLKDTVKPSISIIFEQDWEKIDYLYKSTIIQGFDLSYQKRKLEILNYMNIDPQI
jgi:hypothetical protein